MTAPEQMNVSVLMSAASVYAVAGEPFTMGCATFSPSTSSPDRSAAFSTFAMRSLMPFATAPPATNAAHTDSANAFAVRIK